MDRRACRKALPATGHAATGLAAPGIGVSRPVHGVALNCDDRLARFRRMRVEDVATSPGIDALEPELAEARSTRTRMPAAVMAVAR